MPQRFLRPGLRTSPRWNAVSHESARLYIAILTQVDDFGRHDGRASVLWAEAFSVWNEQNPTLAVTAQETAGFCQQLDDANLVKFYEFDGRKYLQLIQWEERARGKSKWPAPPQDFAVIPLRNPAESCLPSPSPSHKPEPSVAPPFPEAQKPSKREFFDYFKTQACLLPAEWYVLDKWEAAESDNWKGKANWQAYARRVKNWWDSDGRPMEAKSAKTANGKPARPSVVGGRM